MSKRKMNSGLDAFKEILQEYQSLFIWAAVTVAAPLAAAFSTLSPPWPPAIIPVTMLTTLIVLVYVYQNLRNENKETIDFIISRCVSVMIFLGAAYLLAYSQYVYIEPLSKERFVKGLICTDEVMQIPEFKSKCPALGPEQLSMAEWSASRLWEGWSITVVRFTLAGLWVTSFGAFAGVIGAFLVFQSRPVDER